MELGQVAVVNYGTELDLDIIIPSLLQKNGVLGEVFRKAITEFNPLTIKSTWKVDLIKYVETNGESVNLTVFIKEGGLTGNAANAVWKTPTGKVALKMGFDKFEFIGTPSEKLVELRFLK